MKKILSILLITIASGTAALADHAPGHKRLVNVTKDGLAIQGYDPVAYFTDNKPVKGDPKIRSDFNGATYLFVSAAHKTQFDAEPAKYAPAFGGYCGYAASIDRLSPISPEWFQILDGRLVLQHNKKAFDLWNSELKENLVKADANWPGLVDRNGSFNLKTLVNVDDKGVALGGFDPVSYFTLGTPSYGDQRIEATYDGALYHFISQHNREVFEKDPARYVPAYGGFCGYAASIGKVRPADPMIWSIVDGRLIVQHTKGAADLWAENVAANKAKADSNWPVLVVKKAGKKQVIDPLYRFAGIIPVY